MPIFNKKLNIITETKIETYFLHENIDPSIIDVHLKESGDSQSGVAIKLIRKQLKQEISSLNMHRQLKVLDLLYELSRNCRTSLQIEMVHKDTLVLLNTLLQNGAIEVANRIKQILQKFRLFPLRSGCRIDLEQLIKEINDRSHTDSGLGSDPTNNFNYRSDTELWMGAKKEILANVPSVPGVPESDLDKRLNDLYGSLSFPNRHLTPLPLVPRGHFREIPVEVRAVNIGSSASKQPEPSVYPENQDEYSAYTILRPTEPNVQSLRRPPSETSETQTSLRQEDLTTYSLKEKSLKTLPNVKEHRRKSSATSETQTSLRQEDIVSTPRLDGNMPLETHRQTSSTPGVSAGAPGQPRLSLPSTLVGVTEVGSNHSSYNQPSLPSSIFPEEERQASSTLALTNENEDADSTLVPQ